MPSTMFMIPSIPCYKLPPPLFWIAKRCTLSKRNNASLTWTGFILLFVNNVQEISFSSFHGIGVYVKGKRTNRGIGHALEIPAEYVFFENEKVI